MANEIGLTEVTATRQQLIAGIVQETLKQKSILLPTVTDYSQFAVPGASQVGISRRAQFAAANKAENTDLTAQEILFSADTIVFDKSKAIYAKLEKMAAVESNVAVEAEIIQEMADELALQIDKDLLVQLKLVSTAAPDHLLDYANTPTDTLQQTDILEARKLLNKQIVPMDNRFMVIGPDQEKAVLSIADFVQAQTYGNANGLINGELGRLYGFTVLMHTELAAADALFYHKSHCGFGMQLAPQYETMFELKSVSQQYLLYQKYGMKVLDSGKRGVYYNGTGA